MGTRAPQTPVTQSSAVSTHTTETPVTMETPVRSMISAMAGCAGAEERVTVMIIIHAQMTAVTPQRAVSTPTTTTSVMMVINAPLGGNVRMGLVSLRAWSAVMTTTLAQTTHVTAI